MFAIGINIYIRITTCQNGILAVSHQITIYIKYAMAHSRKGGNSINLSIFGININSSTISFIRHIVILNVNTCRILAAIYINYRILPIQSNRTMLNSYNASSIFALGRNMDIRTGITYNNLILVLCIQATSLRPAFCGYIDFRTLDINLTGCCRGC